ncbi:G-protein coupled receptor GRL101-like [Ruditapes philippinarum]|uniref:G-protein coupled receptor GRL101-like n=1 Tax=Ruditapes philippinarum TaxID=129788 RepID=UPI00295B16EA|nr:G-protein coupled receptor GRL101-like [Ruditapes philippinarum]
MKCEENSNTSTTIHDLNIHYSTRMLDLSHTSTFGKDFLLLYFIDIPFRYLYFLNVSHCKISALSDTYFFRMTNLRTLDLSHNQIPRLKRYTFSNLTRLTNLFLHGNALLSYIEPETFHGLKIRSLDLTGCSIFTISRNTFAGLILDNVDISFNYVDKVEDQAFNELTTRQLKLQGNPISVFSKKMFDGLQSVELLHTPAFKFCCIRPLYLREDLCLPYQDEFSSCADLMRHPILQVLLWVIGSLALLGNIASFVYRMHFDRYRLKIGYGIFVTNLAISDLLMGIYMLIIALADNIFRGRYIEADTYWRSSNWCRLAGVLSTLSSEASVFFVALITIDRILVIKFPFGNVRITSQKAVVISVIIWVFAAFLSILPLIYVDYFSDGFYSKSAVCLALPLTRDRPPGWIYSFSVFVIFNFAMFVLIALGQLLIYTEVRNQTKISRRMNVSRKNDLIVARNLLLLVSTDFLCWFPIGVMGLVALNGNTVPGDVYAWTAVLVLPVNSALNPFLYTLTAIMNKKSFNPNIDEQKHENFKKESAISFMRILSHFSPSRKFRYDIDLSYMLCKRPLRIQEVLLIARDLAKGLSVLHNEDLVVHDMKCKTVGIKISYDMVRKAYFNQLPKVLKHNREKSEDMYQFGHLMKECSKSIKVLE